MNFITLCFLMVFPAGDSLAYKEADLLFTKSKTFWYNNRDSAIYYLKAALDTSREHAYLKGEADALKGLGFLSYSSSEQIQYFTRALEIREKLNDAVGIGVSLADIGSIYEQLGDTAQMMNYLQRSYAIRKKIGDNGGIALCLILFGHHEERKGNFTTALRLFREALHYRLIAGEKNGLAFAYVNLGQAHLQLKKYDSAIYYAEKARSKFVESKNTTTTQWTTWLHAKSLFETQKDKEALQLLNDFEKSQSGLSLDNLQLLSRVHEDLKNYREALRYERKWVEETEKQKMNADKTSARRLIADFEFKIQQEELRQKELQSKAVKKRQDNLQFLIIAVLLMTAIVIIIAVRKKTSRRALDISTFLVFMFLFEFLIVLVDPMLQDMSGSAPFFILLGNVVIALIIAPLHNVADKYFKNVITK